MGKAQFRITDDGTHAIGSILFKGNLVEFLIDATDLPRIKDTCWHFASNAYIATSIRVHDVDASGVQVQKKKELYLHNFLLSPAAGQAVQHISKNGLDNRRTNLRIVNVSGPGAAAANHAKKKRTTELPGTSGIKPADIPTHIWYVQANGYHRDRFAIEFKTEGILWKSTSSKDVTLQEKLQQAKTKLEELYELYPHLDPKKEEDAAASLQASFEATLKGSATPSQAPSPPLKG
jgi:hypothetical protein